MGSDTTIILSRGRCFKDSTEKGTAQGGERVKKTDRVLLAAGLALGVSVLLGAAPGGFYAGRFERSAEFLLLFLNLNELLKE